MNGGTVTDRAEQLRLEGLAKVRNNELETALALFDEAAALAPNDEFSELVTINKAGVLIQMRQEGPEIQALPQIVLRRPNVRHTFLAAYNLQNRYTAAQEFRKAYNYVRIALEMADEADDLAWKIFALNATGNICVYESRAEEAIEHYRRVIDLTGMTDEHLFSRAFARQNLGYCLVIEGNPAEGVELIHRAIDEMEQAGASGYAAESYIDLCYGYLELDRLDEARQYGEYGLERATEDRQVRNAHYLLGEVAFKQGDRAAAEAHFEQLGSWYPDFPNLKNVLLALDLRKVVNFKL
jgi:tetratricopeptide (TPR) repeat protein